MADKKIRISDLPLAKSTDGLITLGVSSENESVKIAFGDLLKQYNNAITEAREALSKANEAKNLSEASDATSKEAKEIADNANNLALQSGSSRFDGIVSGVKVQLISYEVVDGVYYDDVNKVFVGKNGEVYCNNWLSADNYMNTSRTAILKDKLYIYDGKVWIWSDTANNLVGVNEDALQAIQEQINKRYESIVLSETEYEALETKKNDVLYLVYEEE